MNVIECKKQGVGATNSIGSVTALPLSVRPAREGSLPSPSPHPFLAGRACTKGDKVGEGGLPPPPLALPFPFASFGKGGRRRVVQAAVRRPAPKGGKSGTIALTLSISISITCRCGCRRTFSTTRRAWCPSGLRRGAPSLRRERKRWEKARRKTSNGKE